MPGVNSPKIAITAGPMIKSDASQQAVFFLSFRDGGRDEAFTHLTQQYAAKDWEKVHSHPLHHFNVFFSLTWFSFSAASEEGSSRTSCRAKGRLHSLKSRYM